MPPVRRRFYAPRPVQTFSHPDQSEERRGVRAVVVRGPSAGVRRREVARTRRRQPVVKASQMRRWIRVLTAAGLQSPRPTRTWPCCPMPLHRRRIPRYSSRAPTPPGFSEFRQVFRRRLFRRNRTGRQRRTRMSITEGRCNRCRSV